ncbi:hypothetical protein FRC01_001529 [Tulasnella sp. 417]|nr:hypothetical protein FRC01_001529 [Tulasnella sp. 417]
MKKAHGHTSAKNIISSFHSKGSGTGHPPKLGDTIRLKYSISYSDGNHRHVLPKGKSESMWFGRSGMPEGFKAGLLRLKAGESGTWECVPEAGFEREVELEDNGKKFKIPAKTELHFDVDLEQVTVGAASN